MRRAALLAALLLSACGKGASGPAPRQIHIAGASAAFPFSTAAAERLMRERPDVLAPLVRAGGSGAGIAAFCSGLAPRFPDIVIAIRAPTPAELAHCRSNGVSAVAQVVIGRTALVIAAAPALPGLSLAQLYAALAGPARYWSDVDARLPAVPIRIHGPAAAPGLADGLDDLLLGPGCRAARAAACAHPRLRGDGAYVGHGADAEAIAAAALADPGSIAILPYAQARTHADRLPAIPLDGVTPTAATITAGTYPATAPLVLLAKRQDSATVPGLAILLSYYAQALQPGGAFAAQGLISPDHPAAVARQLKAIFGPAARL